MRERHCNPERQPRISLRSIRATPLPLALSPLPAYIPTYAASLSFPDCTARRTAGSTGRIRRTAAARLAPPACRRDPRSGAPADRADRADLWGDRIAHRRRPRQHLPLDARRRLEASAVCAARDRHGAARTRQCPVEAAHACRTPRRAHRALYPRAGAERGHRSRQARRGAGAPEDGESRRPAAAWQAAAPLWRRGAARNSRRTAAPDHGTVCRRCELCGTPRRRPSTTSSQTARHRPRSPAASAATASAAATITRG